MREPRKPALRGRSLRAGLVALGALAFTLAFFLVLPLIQAISNPPKADRLLYRVDAASLPPPPAPPEPDEPVDEPEPREEPPELEEESAPLELAQLENVMNPSEGSGWMSGDLAARLDTDVAARDDVGGIVSIADLDERPRPTFRPGPALDPELRRKTPGEVTVIFVVDQRGRVENPIAKSSTDPAFEHPALAAVKKWRFEPGKRQGQPVRFRMRQQFTFPK
jgi:protein TonB